MQQAVALVPPQAAKAGYKKIVFEDQFDTLDMSPDGGGTHRWYNSIWTVKPRSPNLFKVHNGVLSLTTVPVDQWGAATAITTMPRKPGGHPNVFRFGYFEAKLRFNNNKDNWAAFFLYSAWRSTIASGKANGRWCEIDVVESMYPRVYAGTVHDWFDSKSTANPNAHMFVPTGMDINDSWNVFGLLWQPGSITWYLNNVKVGTAPSPVICDNDDMFLILSSQKKRGLADQVLDVDWIRVYR